MILRAISTRQLGSSLLVLLCGLAGLPAAHAQQGLEEVIVTAQKREQRQEDVGIAVTALSGEQIREWIAEDEADLRRFGEAK